MGGQNVDPVTTAQAQLAQGAADQAAAGRDQHLDGFGFDRGQLVDQPDVLALLQAQKLGHFGAQDDPVALGKDHGAQIAAQRGVAAQHVDHPHAIGAEQVDLEHRAADEARTLGHGDLGEVFHAAPIGQKAAHRLPVGQEPFAEQHDEGPARQRDRDADRGDFKDGEGRKALFHHHPVDQDVGRGADQRDHAAHDREM